MRVVVLGNSHLGALKKAWEDGAQLHPELELVFFGSPRQTMRELNASGNELTTDSEKTRKYLALTSGMEDPVIRINEYDVVFLHGLIQRNRMIPLSVKLEQYTTRTGSMPTSGLIRAIMAEEFENSMFWHLAREIRKISNVPLIAAPQPYQSEDSKHYAAAGEELAKWPLAARYDGFAEDRVRSFGASYLPQPPETLVNHVFTRREYCLDAVHLTRQESGAEEGNLSHMNARFGALVLRDLAAYLRSSSVGQRGDSTP